MKKDYYEILQVSRNASKEVIDRVYKMLAKKYHPDLQSLENKELYAEKFKEVNEAYQVLGDELKRAQYDEKIKANYVPKAEFEKLRQENIMLKNIINGNTRKSNNYQTTTYQNNIRQQQQRNTHSTQNTYQQKNNKQQKRSYFEKMTDYIYEKIILIGVIIFMLLVLRMILKGMLL